MIISLETVLGFLSTRFEQDDLITESRCSYNPEAHALSRYSYDMHWKQASTDYSATRSVARHLPHWFPIHIPIWNIASNWQVASSPMYIFDLFVTFFAYLQCFYFKSLFTTGVWLCRTIRRKEANQCPCDAASVLAKNVKTCGSCYNWAVLWCLSLFAKRK